MEPYLDVEGSGDEALSAAHFAERIGFVDRQTPGTREMDQKEIVLHQIASEALLGQLATGQQKHKRVADIRAPVPIGRRDQTREKGWARRPSAETEAQLEQQVAGRRGKLYRQTVQLLADDDLATEARRHREIERQVQHIFLVLARLGEQLVPLWIDDDMARRAGERAFAGAFDIDVVAARDFEHRHSDRRIDLAPGAVALDKDHLRHYSGRGARSSARIAAVSTAFAPADSSAFRLRRNILSPAASAAACSLSDKSAPAVSARTTTA